MQKPNEYYKVPNEFFDIMMALKEAGQTDLMYKLSTLVGEKGTEEGFNQAQENASTTMTCNCPDCEAEANDAGEENRPSESHLEDYLNSIFNVKDGKIALQDIMQAIFEDVTKEIGSTEPEQTDEPEETKSAPQPTKRQIAVTMAHDIYHEAMARYDFAAALNTLYFIQNNDLWN